MNTKSSALIAHLSILSFKNAKASKMEKMYAIKEFIANEFQVDEK